MNPAPTAKRLGDLVLRSVQAQIKVTNAVSNAGTALYELATMLSAAVVNDAINYDSARWRARSAMLAAADLLRDAARGIEDPLPPPFEKPKPRPCRYCNRNPCAPGCMGPPPPEEA